MKNKTMSDGKCSRTVENRIVIGPSGIPMGVSGSGMGSPLDVPYRIHAYECDVCQSIEDAKENCNVYRQVTIYYLDNEGRATS